MELWTLNHYAWSPKSVLGVLSQYTELSSVKTLRSVIVYECNFISLPVKIILPKYLCKTGFQYAE